MKAKQFLGVTVALLFVLSTFEAALAVSGHDFHYDDNGNLVQDDGYYYEYNDANQLKLMRRDNSTGPAQSF